MARRAYPRPTAKEVSKRYKRYKKITKGAATGARMTKGQFIKFNYPDYTYTGGYPTSRTKGLSKAMRSGMSEKELARFRRKKIK